MHGVPRNRVVDAKEQEQKRKKIEKWNGFKKQIFEERQNGVLTKDQIEKQEYKNLLLLSPEFYSFWNYRKEIITNLVKNIDNEEDKKAIYKKELELTEQVLKERHTKSYGTWHHRKWCITHLPEAWNNELLLTDKLLSYDSRNFHCWNYREYIIQELLKQEPDVELQYCENLLGRDNDGLLNYSAFHYRSAMLRRKHAEEGIPLSDLLKDEWNLIANAIYTDAFNQSAWIYNRWLLNEMSTDKEFIEQEVTTCKEILELEKDQCKWALMTMVISQIGNSMDNEKANELLQAVDKLIELDPSRAGYYRDLKSDLHIKHVAKRDGKKLDLSNANLTRFHALSDSCFQDLEELDLSNNSIRLIPPINLPKLKMLILDNNQIEFLDNLDKFNSLERLSLKNNRVVDVMGEVVANDNLTEIDLSGNTFKPTLENLRSSFPKITTIL